jgi:hypothetical protein
MNSGFVSLKRPVRGADPCGNRKICFRVME